MLLMPPFSLLFSPTPLSFFTHTATIFTSYPPLSSSLFFFLKDTATPEIYPLPLPDPLPISRATRHRCLTHCAAPAPAARWHKPVQGAQPPYPTRSPQRASLRTAPAAESNIFKRSDSFRQIGRAHV